MTEAEALQVTALRVIESADAQRSWWSDDDRAWASAAAAAEVGAGASPEQFVVCRARLALARLERQRSPWSGAVRMLAWRPWVGVVAVLAAALAGLFVDRIGAAQRINVMDPPVLLLIAWNVFVYLLLLLALVWPGAASRRARPLRAGLASLGQGLRLGRGRRPSAVAGHALASLSAEWGRQAAPLYLARTERILHLAAATLAAGVVAGMYLRGLVLEYRASWESTFLDPSAVRAILSVMLAPGVWLSGHPLAGLDRLAAMRAPGSENAATWLHLIAWTVMVVIVLPRLLLAAWAWRRERRMQRAFALALDRPYFQRLLRDFGAPPARVCVLPYGFAVPEPAQAALRCVLVRVLGATASVRIQAPVPYGEDDDRVRAKLSSLQGPLVLLFNLAATPERETHLAFVHAAVDAASSQRPVLVLIDETSFKARVADAPQRLLERRHTWQGTLRQARVEPVFIDLTDPGVALEGAVPDTAWFVPAS